MQLVMARRSSKPVITMQMYRHFALATVGLTTLLAIMADGEKREAVAATANSAAETVREAEFSTTLTSKSSKFTTAPAPRRGGGGGGYIDTSHAGPERTTAGRSGRPEWVEQLAIMGISLTEFQAMSKDRQEEILAMLKRKPSPVEEADAIRAASQASLARSGGGQSQDF